MTLFNPKSLHEKPKKKDFERVTNRFPKVEKSFKQVFVRSVPKTAGQVPVRDFFFLEFLIPLNADNYFL